MRDQVSVLLRQFNQIKLADTHLTLVFKHKQLVIFFYFTVYYVEAQHQKTLR